VAALDEDRLTLACREAADRLLVQHDRFSPLSDRQFAALVPTGETWVIADPPTGCWSLEPLAGFADAWSLVTLGPAHRLTSGDAGWADAADAPWQPEPEPLRVVPSSSTAGATVDAVLLEPDDLPAVRLLLEGHPLAETAVVVPGRDRYLLLAPGGVADQIPVGRYLASVGR
jgi:hypothetical protein